MVAVAGFDFVLIDGEHGPADVVELRRHIAAAQLYDVPVLVRVGSASRPSSCGPSTPAPSASSRRTSTPLSRPPRWSMRRLPAARAPRLRDVRAGGPLRARRPTAHQERMLTETLVFGMIESPAGSGRRRIAATTGSTGSWSASPTWPRRPRLADPPPTRARGTSTRSWRTRASADEHRQEAAAAETSFDDGAQLVVYNLTATVMAHLAELRTASADGHRGAVGLRFRGIRHADTSPDEESPISTSSTDAEPDVDLTFRLDGRVAMITGGVSGIGAAIADVFADAGARVVVVDLDAATSERRAGELGRGAVGVGCDVSDPASVDAAVAQAIRPSATSTSSSTAPASSTSPRRRTSATARGTAPSPSTSAARSS